MKITITVAPEDKERVLAAFAAANRKETATPADIKQFLTRKLRGVISSGERQIAERKAREEETEVSIT